MIGIMPTAEELLRTTPIFSRLSPADRKTIAEVARVHHFEKGDVIFEQDSPSEFYAITAGRVKIFKLMPNGKDLILEVFGKGSKKTPKQVKEVSRKRVRESRRLVREES